MLFGNSVVICGPVNFIIVLAVGDLPVRGGVLQTV